MSLFNSYDDHKFIGNGAFSNVYKVYNRLDDNFYAIKKIGVNNISATIVEEVRSMAKLNHPNIVRYHMSWIESNKQTSYSNQKLIKYDIEKSLSEKLILTLQIMTKIILKSFYLFKWNYVAKI